MSISFKASVCANGVKLSSLTGDRVPRKCKRTSIVTNALKADGQEKQSSRRNILSILIGAGLTVQGAAEASYYSDLLETSKKPDTTQLLKAYEKTKKSEPKSKAKKLKSVRSKGTLNPSPAIEQGDSGFGATGLVVGGLGIAGAAALGRSSSKKKESIRSPSRLRTAVKKPVNQPSQVRKPKPVAKSQGTIKKPTTKLASSGTVRLVPKSTGTVIKPARKGPVTKKSGNVEKSEKQSILGPAVGLGLVSIFAVYLLASPNTAPRQEKEVTPKEEVSQAASAVVETPKMEPAPVKEETNEVKATKAQQPPDVSSKAQASASGTSKSKLPPTTGNSPVVLVGGSILTLVVAAAVGASPTSQESTSVTSTSTDGTPESRAAEARAWIASWKSRQNEISESRAAEAKAWIEAWKKKQK